MHPEAHELDLPMAWSDACLLGYAPLDAVHREFVDLVGALQAAPDADLPGRLADVSAHAVAHFEEERRWMQESSFPAMQCHSDEHEAVLRSLHEVGELVRAGAPASLCRDLAAALAGWFPRHVDHMDAALSHWMSRRRYGGLPVVIRRRPEVKLSPGPVGGTC